MRQYANHNWYCSSKTTVVETAIKNSVFLLPSCRHIQTNFHCLNCWFTLTGLPSILYELLFKINHVTSKEYYSTNQHSQTGYVFIKKITRLLLLLSINYVCHKFCETYGIDRLGNLQMWYDWLKSSKHWTFNIWGIWMIFFSHIHIHVCIRIEPLVSLLSFTFVAQTDDI